MRANYVSRHTNGTDNVWNRNAFVVFDSNYKLFRILTWWRLSLVSIVLFVPIGCVPLHYNKCSVSAFSIIAVVVVIVVNVLVVLRGRANKIGYVAIFLHIKNWPVYYRERMCHHSSKKGDDCLHKSALEQFPLRSFCTRIHNDAERIIMQNVRHIKNLFRLTLTFNSKCKTKTKLRTKSAPPTNQRNKNIKCGIASQPTWPT